MSTQSEEFRRQPPPPLAPRPISLPRPQETILSNGMTVVVVEDSRLPLVSFRLAFGFGDAHDPANLPGLSDMLAGLLTEGTESRTSRQIADETARMGATLTAGASSDYTTIAGSALARFNEAILELIADVTMHPSFPEHEVELVRQNSKESLKQQRAQPSFLATEMVSRVMFGNHPYSVVAPTPESIDATSRTDIADFHQRKYVPNNAVLIVVGDVRAEDTIRRAESLFGQWAPGEQLKNDFPAPPARTARSAYLIDRPGSAQSNIVIANNGITRTNADYFPLLLMHTVFGATASSRLFMNLREEKGYTYGAYSNLDARRTAGTFRSSAEVRTPVTGDSLKEFFYELNRIRTEPVSQKEISDAKSYLTGVFPIRLETQEGIVDQLVQIKMLGLGDNYLHEYRDRVQSVSVADIQRVARKYILPDQAAIIIVGDGAQVIDQLKPFTESIEIYNTAGKRKAGPGSSTALSADILGEWALEFETPLGQAIPATMIVSETASGPAARIDSEMGSADLSGIENEGNAFTASISFDMEGQMMEGQISGTLQGDHLDGTLSLQGFPSLNFTGKRI
ncbi:MAG TPA: pitrilysin family protein [Pyrinomonadaceae bacterium]|nr:pitrilysin family protein [Pyrinomonadaceae bacterium]